MAKYKLGSISLSSSTDPEKLATTVQGGILALSSVIIYLAGSFFNINITAGNVAEMAGLVGGLIGAVATVFGLLRKIVAWYTEVKAQ